MAGARGRLYVTEAYDVCRRYVLCRDALCVMPQMGAGAWCITAKRFTTASGGRASGAGTVLLLSCPRALLPLILDTHGLAR